MTSEPKVLVRPKNHAKKLTKAQLEANIRFAEHDLERMKADFQKKFEELQGIMEHGRGVENIHMGSTLTSMNNLFALIVGRHKVLQQIKATV